MTTAGDDLPAIEITQTTGKANKAGQLDVSVTNDSDVPQYELQIYAWARDGDKLVAAGTGKVADLEGGETANVRVTLAGDSDGTKIEVSAPPSIFK